MTLVRNGKHCHKMVAETAKAMAGELYEILMYDNQMRADAIAGAPDMTDAQRQVAFIARNWGSLIDQARANLAGMLGDPAYDQSTKDAIYDALRLDNTLRYGRKRRWAQGQFQPLGRSIDG